MAGVLERTQMADWSTTSIRGQDSLLLETRSVELALTITGGMLGPVKFLLPGGVAVQPYAVAPWAEEAVSVDMPKMIAALRGDWFCSAFGGNSEHHGGQRLPPHGETANREWRGINRREGHAGCWLRLGLDLPLQHGRCESTTAILHDEHIIYQRHDLSELKGPINPGHHATLAFPNVDGAGRLSFGKVAYAQTYIEPTEQPRNRGYSWLKPDSEIPDLHAAPCVDGSTSDLCSYPARRGFEDIVIVCADASAQFGWTAVTFPAEGFVWFALRDSKQLVSTLLWFSNGGRHYPPWNGRHVNVLGIEDITAFFHVGIAASCRPNRLTERGIRTCIEPDAHGRLSIPYIQGVAGIPAGFDEVATIEPAAERGHILLTAKSGAAATTRCQLDFLRTGRLPSLDFS
jgi:hypothetical protein